MRRRITCSQCGATLRPRLEARVVFHPCTPPRRGFDWRPPRQRLDDERAEWARTVLGAGFEEAVTATDPDALLRGDDTQ